MIWKVPVSGELSPVRSDGFWRKKAIGCCCSDFELLHDPVAPCRHDQAQESHGFGRFPGPDLVFPPVATKIHLQDHPGEPGLVNPMKSKMCQRDTNPVRLYVPLLGSSPEPPRGSRGVWSRVRTVCGNGSAVAMSCAAVGCSTISPLSAIAGDYTAITDDLRTVRHRSRSSYARCRAAGYRAKRSRIRTQDLVPCT